MHRILTARRRAFTLLELVVVAVVLGVLAAIAAPRFDAVRTESVDRSLTTTADAFVVSVRAAAASDGSGGVVSVAHLASALSELPSDAEHVVTSESEVVFVLADRQVVVSASDGAVSKSGPSPCAQASGGDDVHDIVVDGVSYRVHVFSTVGTSTFTAYCDMEVDFLVVGGGGEGGGRSGGGGGGGGVVFASAGLPAGSADVVVGAGGSGPAVERLPEAGDPSSFAGMVAYGGGYGGQLTYTFPQLTGGDGGSGGGAAGAKVSPTPTGGSGVAGQGLDGAPGAYTPPSWAFGGGGGGAGASPVGRNGGAGVDMSHLFGGSVGDGGYFGGGGGASGDGNPASVGGLGGGGRGGYFADRSGAAGTGGGGGGGGTADMPPSAGGSGAVLIRYPFG